MTDLVRTVEQPVAVPTAARDNLDRLVARIAAGDRAAFRLLYAFLAFRVWHSAARAMPHSRHAFAITRSTFLEVWHTAGAAAHHDARDWIGAITAVRVDERCRLVGENGYRDLQDGAAGLREQAADLVGQDARIYRELARVLGPGRATIRVGPVMFVGIDDLDGALDAIVATGRDNPIVAAALAATGEQMATGPVGARQ